MVVHADYPWISWPQFKWGTHFGGARFVEPVSVANHNESTPKFKAGFLAYRAVMVVASITIWIMSIANNPQYAGIYLTVWSLTLVMLHFIAQAAILAYKLKNQDLYTFTGLGLTEEGEEDPKESLTGSNQGHKALPLAEKLGWVLATVASGASVLVTLMFWVALYPNLDKDVPAYKFLTNLVFPHVLNFVFMLIDGIIAKIPFRIHHFYVTLAYLLIYGTFYIVYWAAGGTDRNGGPVYAVMDFSNKPGEACAYFVGIAVTSPLLGGFWHLCSWLRELAAKRVTGS